jgi:hypothetical protein
MVTYPYPYLTLGLKIKCYPLIYRMSNHTTCYICDEKVSFPCKNKHLFSKKHHQDIQGAIVKRKDSFMTWIGQVENRITKPMPVIRFKGRPYNICLVCKKIGVASDSYVNCPCGKAADNAQAIKDILASANTPLTQTESNPELQEENKSLKEEIEKLKAANLKLTAQKRELQSQLGDAEEPYDCLLHIFSHYQEKDTDILNKTIDLIKGDCYSATYSRLKKELYLDE